jgi:ParB-like chromosome segregation protein Spo0J
MSLMTETPVPIDQIYVPVKRQREIDSGKVDAIAESILEEGLQQPIQVRYEAEKERYVLVSGLQRLEAMKALGERTIPCLIVRARKH